ncbi:MAG: MFS transporter [Chloroflexi bacterium]|nr:MFS transporter [Chloroflexota bacterium]
MSSAVVSRMLAAFDAPPYRWLWSSNFLHSVSLTMYSLTIGWLALSLGNSPFWVGLVAGLMGVGQMGFGLFGGVLVDRLDKRLVLIYSHLASGAVMMALGILAATNLIALWHVLLAALMQGALLSVHVPASNAMTYQIVGRERSMNASAAGMMSWTLSRIAGSMIAGALISTLGIGSSFVVTGGFSVASSLLALLIQGAFKSPASSELFWRSA